MAHVELFKTEKGEHGRHQFPSNIVSLEPFSNRVRCDTQISIDRSRETLASSNDAKSSVTLKSSSLLNAVQAAEFIPSGQGMRENGYRI